MARTPEGIRLKRDERTGKFTVRFRHNQRRYNFSTGETDPHEAQQRAAEIYQATVEGRTRAVARGVAATATPLLELGAQWLADAEAALDHTTATQYGMYLASHFEPFFITLDRITDLSCADYVRTRLREVRRKTLLKELSALRGFLRWAEEQGHLSAAPVVKAPAPRATGTAAVEQREQLVLTPAEVAAVLEQLPERSPRGFPIRARFEVAWETALRPSTLDELRAPGDYHPGRETLRIRDESDKARYGRELPISAAARDALDRVCPKSGVIFGRHDFREWLEACGVEGLTPYTFRHSRLTMWAETSSNLPGIQFLAGHKHATTTARYIHPSRRAAEDVLGHGLGHGTKAVKRKSAGGKGKK